MAMKKSKFTAMRRHQAQENKRWEADIIWQISITRRWEETAIHNKVEQQALTHESKQQELFLLLKILDLKLISEISQAMAYEAKVQENSNLIGASQRRTRHLLRLRKNWYLDKAQEHRNRAQQLGKSMNDLETLFLQCSASLRQIRLQKLEMLSQLEPKMKFTGMPQSSMHGSRMSDMKSLAMHNNLLAQLEWQKVKTAQQEASLSMHTRMCLQQQKITANLQQYYNSLKDNDNI